MGTSFVTVSDKSSSRPATKTDIELLKRSYKNALEAAANSGGNRRDLTAEQAYVEVFKSGKKDWSGAWINTVLHEVGHQVLQGRPDSHGWKDRRSLQQQVL